MPARSMDSYLETSGVRLRYRDEGRGRALIFAHGWTLDLEQWDSQAAALAGEYRVVRWDRRGFGLSSGSPSAAGDGLDLAALCGHLGLDSVALVGMSQGARVVLQFAASHPEMTACLIVDGPPHFGGEHAAGGSRDIPYEHYRELAQTRGLSAFRREWSEHALTQLRTADPEARGLLARMIARYPGKDLIAADHGEARPVAPDFGSVDRPALVMSGEFDLDSRKRYARHLASQLARVECIEIPDAGHLCNLDNPVAYTEALGRFLERHASPINGQ